MQNQCKREDNNCKFTLKTTKRLKTTNDLQNCQKATQYMRQAKAKPIQLETRRTLNIRRSLSNQREKKAANEFKHYKNATERKKLKDSRKVLRDGDCLCPTSK